MSKLHYKSDTCIVAGCEEPRLTTKKNRTFYRCQKHQREEWRRLSDNQRRPNVVGRGLAAKTIKRRPDPMSGDHTCNILGCNEPRHVIPSGMVPRCQYHMNDYQRRYREGIPQLPTKSRTRAVMGKTICIVEGCGKPRRFNSGKSVVYRCDEHQTAYIKAKYDKHLAKHGKKPRVKKVIVEVATPKPIATPKPPKPVVVAPPPAPAPVVVAPPKPAKPVKPTPVVTQPTPPPTTDQFKTRGELIRESIRIQIRPFLGGSKDGN